MNNDDSIIGWVLAAVTTIGGALAGTVTMFYKQQITDLRALIGEHKATALELKAETEIVRKRAVSCEEDRNILRTEHAVLKQRYETLEIRVTDLEATKANRETVNRRIDELTK